MEVPEKEYEEKTSFLECYMAAEFIEINKNVIVQNYETPDKKHQLSLEKARGILIDADKITMEVFRKNEFNEVMEAKAKLPDASQLTQRDKFYMQLVSYSEFVVGDDFNVPGQLAHTYILDRIKGYLAMRNFYKTQWLTGSPEDIKKALALELHEKNDPYIPLQERIKHVCKP